MTRKEDNEYLGDSKRYEHILKILKYKIPLNTDQMRFKRDFEKDNKDLSQQIAREVKNY